MAGSFGGALTGRALAKSLAFSLCLESLARSLEADEDARPAGCRLFRARGLQRAGPAGLGSAGARLGRGDAAGLPAA